MSSLRLRRMTRSRGMLIAAVIVAVLLVVQMVTQVVGAVIADRGGAEAASDVYTYVGDLMAERVAGVADSASDVVQGTASEIARAGRVPEREALVAALAARLDREPAVGSVFIGTPDGTVTALARADDGYSLLVAEPGPGRGRDTLVTRTAYLPSLVAGESESTTLDYELGRRAWYQAAVAAAGEGVAWSEPYVSARTGEVAVSPAEAVVVDGAVIAAVGADLDLERLGALLGDIPVGEDARAFILSTDGRVIAAPDTARDRVTAVLATTGEVPLATQLGLAPTAPQPEVTAADELFAADGTLSLERALDPSRGPSWVLRLQTQEDDLAPGLHRFRVGAITVTVVSLVMLLVAAGFALRIWRPVRAMRTRAATDPLTGLANRYEFERQGAALAARAAGLGSTVMVVMIDLDRFKSLNDTLGHDAGDLALRAVGRAMRATLRSRDVAARLGGDEFAAVLMIGADGDAREVAQRLRDDVEAAAREGTGTGELLGVTAGFATSDECGHDLEELRSAADHALVQGKHRHKGRVYGPHDGREDEGPLVVSERTEEA